MKEQDDFICYPNAGVFWKLNQRKKDYRVVVTSRVYRACPAVPGATGHSNNLIDSPEVIPANFF